MHIPPPEPGLVIRYAYLWDRDYRAGQEEGKDRPCAIIVASKSSDEITKVLVLPVTHTEPEPDVSAVEIPPKIKQAIGLDHDRSWIVVSECNTFVWPGPDVRAVPGKQDGSIAYGHLPPNFFKVIRDELSKELKFVPRPE